MNFPNIELSSGAEATLLRPYIATATNHTKELDEKGMIFFGNPLMRTVKGFVLSRELFGRAWQAFLDKPRAVGPIYTKKEFSSQFSRKKDAGSRPYVFVNNDGEAYLTDKHGNDIPIYLALADELTLGYFGKPSKFAGGYVFNVG